jgi:chromosome segregation ATPase
MAHTFKQKLEEIITFYNHSKLQMEYDLKKSHGRLVIKYEALLEKNWELKKKHKEELEDLYEQLDQKDREIEDLECEVEELQEKFKIHDTQSNLQDTK